MIVRTKRTAKQLIGFALLIIFTRCVIAYTNYEFEIPFFIRQKQDGAAAEESSREDNQDYTGGFTAQTTGDINSLHMVVNPDDLIERPETVESRGSQEDNASVEDSDDNSGDVADSTEENSNSAFPPVEELMAKGFYISDGVYEKYSAEGTLSSQAHEYVFAKLSPEFELPTSRIVQSAAGNIYTVEPAMDFLLVHYPDNTMLCNSLGKIIAEHLSFNVVTGRDENNSPVLSDTRYEYSENEGDEENEENEENEEGKQIEVTRYFVYDKTMKSFIQSNYDPLHGDRGVPFMYPSYYGANGASGVSRYESDGKWGYYIHGTETPAIWAEYDMAYNFSENTGIAYKLEQKGVRGEYYDVKRLYFLDIQGTVLNSDYFAPAEVTSEHLGFFYFDNGLTRVYKREFDSQGRTTIEKDILVDKDGKEFYIPEDYTIKSYSNGVILLEKDNYYGFMNYNGDWIAQPIFRYAEPFYEGVAVVGIENGRKALIDTDGNLIVRFYYDYISNCSGGLVALYERNEGWTILAKMRKDTIS